MKLYDYVEKITRVFQIDPQTSDYHIGPRHVIRYGDFSTSNPSDEKTLT